VFCYFFIIADIETVFTNCNFCLNSVSTMSQPPILMKNGTIITSISGSLTIKVFKSSILIRDGMIAKTGDNLPENGGVQVIDWVIILRQSMCRLSV
jgi:hypothetical protein